jgi:thioredoxin-related protein
MRLFICLCLLFSLRAQAGDTTHLYDPKADAAKDVARLVQQAKAENKRVLLQVGGNWCVMCYRLNAFVQLDSVLKKLVAENYIVYHLNYSPENKNAAYLKTIGSPQQFGFPVLVVLDAEGRRLHTQDSGALQKGNGYSFEKVKAFLEQWKL